MITSSQYGSKITYAQQRVVTLKQLQNGLSCTNQDDTFRHAFKATLCGRRSSPGVSRAGQESINRIFIVRHHDFLIQYIYSTNMREKNSDVRGHFRKIWCNYQNYQFREEVCKSTGFQHLIKETAVSPCLILSQTCLCHCSFCLCHCSVSVQSTFCLNHARPCSVPVKAPILHVSNHMHILSMPSPCFPSFSIHAYVLLLSMCLFYLCPCPCSVSFHAPVLSLSMPLFCICSCPESVSVFLRPCPCSVSV
jgi:hypothetical protein